MRICVNSKIQSCKSCYLHQFENAMRITRCPTRFGEFSFFTVLFITCLDLLYKFLRKLCPQLTHIILWLMNKSIQQISRSVEFSIKYAYLAKLQPWWVRWWGQSREKSRWNKPLCLNFGSLLQDTRRWQSRQLKGINTISTVLGPCPQCLQKDKSMIKKNWSNKIYF